MTQMDELEKLSGPVYPPEHDGYAAASTPWNLGVQQRPDYVAVAETEADVVAAVRLAARRKLPIAVQATGHGVVAAADDALLINTARMRGVSVDPATRTAWVGAGAKWEHVLHATAEYGLAPLSGFSADVSAVGYSLGGGFGWLARKYGFASDSILAADLVTVDGEQLHINDNSLPELFDAVRGGGGNFGVVTSAQFQLFPVSTVYGGGICFPMERAGDVFVAYRDWAATLPPEVTSAIALFRFPPMPELPEPLRGRNIVAVLAAFLDGEDEGKRLLAPISALPGAVFNTFGTLPYQSTPMIANEPVDPMPFVGYGDLLSSLSDDAIATILDVAGPSADAQYIVFEVRHLGGGNRPAADRLDFAHWDAEYLMHAASITPVPEAVAGAKAYYAGMHAALQPYSTGGSTLNFLGSANTDPDRVRAAFSPERYQRLVAIKKQYDPANLLCFNHNIPPTG